MIISIGIDPGATGAFVMLEDGKFSGNDLDVQDYGEFFQGLLSEKLYLLEGNDLVIAVERQQSMPKQGVASMFTLGQRYGEILGVVNAFMTLWAWKNSAEENKSVFLLYTPAPQEWQRFIFGSGAIGTPKQRSLSRAKQLFPELPLIPDGCRTPRHGRSDAALISYWGYKKAIDSMSKS